MGGRRNPTVAAETGRACPGGSAHENASGNLLNNIIAGVCDQHVSHRVYGHGSRLVEF